MPATQLQSFEVKSPIKHGGRIVRPGEVVDLDDRSAASLVASGVVVPHATPASEPATKGKSSPAAKPAPTAAESDTPNPGGTGSAENEQSASTAAGGAVANPPAATPSLKPEKKLADSKPAKAAPAAKTAPAKKAAK